MINTLEDEIGICLSDCFNLYRVVDVTGTKWLEGLKLGPGIKLCEY